MKIIFIALIFVIFIPINLLSQIDSVQTFNNSLGLKYSNLSGYGILYNRRISDDFRIQINGVIYYFFSDENKEKHSNLNYDFGLELQRNIYKNQTIRAYILAGAYYYYDNDEKKSPDNKTLQINNSFNAGAGVAVEFIFGRFIVGADLGYKFYEDHIEITENSNKPYPVLKREMKTGIGMTVGFIF